MDNALKAVAESPYELVVKNKIVVFGGRDLTGYAGYKNADGSLGERFSKSVDLESEYTATGRLYVDFEHGRDPDGIGNDKNNILGFVDWKTAEVVDDGVIVQRVLNRRHKYMKWLEPLIKAGLVGNSSEAVPEGVKKSADGTIEKWALKRDTLTLTPMEPRMIADNALAIKAMLEDFPQYKSLFALEDAALSDAGDKTIQTNFYGKVKLTNPPHEVNKMDELETKAADIAAKAVADAFAKREAEEKAKAEKAAELKAAADAAYKQALEDVKTAKVPTFYHSTEPTNDDNDGVGAFKSWMGTGQENQGLIRPDESFSKISSAKAAWNVTTGGSGGFLVPDPLYSQIVEKRSLQSWIRQAPVQHFQTQSDHLLVPRESTSLTAFTLTNEAAAYTEEEGTVTQKDLILYKYTKVTKVSEEFLMYNSTNWESWFTNAMARAEAVTENTFSISGTGTGQPEGLSNGATASALTIKTSAQLNPEDLTALIGKLGAGYNVQSECGFVGANASKWYLKNAILAGPFAYASNNGIQGAPDFFGYPFFINDDIQSYTATSGVVLYFGNMNYYGVVEKPGMIVQRNPYLYMANGQIGIFASIFRGAGVLQAEAIYSVNGK